MKKRTALLLNFILLSGCLFFLFVKPTLDGAIRYQWGTEQEIEVLKSSSREAAETFFTELAFSGEKLAYEKDTATFYLPLNMDQAEWETGELTSLAPDVHLLFEDDFVKEDKQDVIRNGERFRFYAVRGEEYQECYLVLTGLPILAIETAETADTDIFGGMAYFWDSANKQNWTSESILEAHIRGYTSRTYEKKGYRLTLKTQDKDGNLVKDKKSLFGLREDDEWILNAMYSDSSKIRDKMSIDVWNAVGAKIPEFPDAKFGTDFTYVEVFFNQEYWGLYGLMEPIDSKQLDLTKEHEPEPTEYSYKSVTPQNVRSDELETQSMSKEELAGYELKGSYSSISRSNWEPLISYLKLRDMKDDEVFARRISEKTNTESTLRVWIYLQAVLGIDNRAKNMYYVAKNVGDSQKIFTIPWDMDLSWGDALSEGTGENIWDVGLNTMLYGERINWHVGDRLVSLDVEDAQKYVEETWKTLRTGVLSDESLSAAVEEQVHRIEDSGALRRNERRWPKSNSGTDYEQFERLAIYRMHFLDYYFAGNLDEYLRLGYE